MQVIDKRKASQILSAWSALEVLSPQVFRRREDLVSGNKQLIASLDDKMPWEKGGEIPPKGKKIYYQVIIGTLHFGNAITAIMQKYPDTTMEKSRVAGHAILAVVLVDQQGCLLKNSASISSFAWGVTQVLNGKLKELDGWPVQEKLLLDGLDKKLRQKNASEAELPLNRATIESGYRYLVETLSLSPDIARDITFATKMYVQATKVDQPQPYLLNSFYLSDLTNAIERISKNDSPANLNRYLGLLQPKRRYDLLNFTALRHAVAPISIPPARWPGAGKHPLVMLQQAAVNVALTTLKEGGILAVNGPPGTGKSTLLRDVIAGVVTKRALAMTTFNDPESAFLASGDKVKAGQGWLQLYELDAKLKGYEIVIASSNNKAVENVSAELPSMNAIADDANELRYFKPISDSLFGYDSWGLMAAVLGNSANRYRFNQTFWWDREVGISTYLAHICGVQQLNDVTDATTKKVIGQKIPTIIADCDPPKNHAEALSRWEDARAEFQALYVETTSCIAELERVREGVDHLDSYPDVDNILALIDVEISQHAMKKRRNAPSLKSGKVSAWQKTHDVLAKKRKRIELALLHRKKLHKHIVNNQSSMLSHADLHHMSPWCDDDMQALRDKLFISAMKLHKAFIDAAAKPLRHNLALFMQHLVNPFSLNIKKSTILPDLWSTFFLVVPTISTTFASVQQMLGKLPSESIGWLLIDEAGQAAPQSAVGAIMRSKRAIVVGDPMQIEPVIQLPSHLTDNILRHFDIDPAIYNAPAASVQTLADQASSYYAELKSDSESRQIGIPLLVHRRCMDPMFSISNSIAYERLMIQAKKPNVSIIRDCLGPSTWFDVAGYADDKWCAEEGAKLLELLTELSRQPVAPDIYILTPFVIVANKIREMILNRKLLQYWGIHNEFAWLYERVGTVHTVQGREAEAIIFVLGAPSFDQQGARAWAGVKPNLLNVAVTRAKEVMYVIGNKSLWRDAGVFSELANKC